MKVSFRHVDWEFVAPFRIAYRTRTHAQTIVVELSDDSATGRGEALGVSYRGETVDSLLDQLHAVERDLRKGISRQDLQSLLPPGGARNAVDCALWDLEAKRESRRVWELLGLRSVRPLLTAYTLSVDSPQVTALAAARAAQFSLLKIKLTGEADLDRIELVRKARPDAEIIVDANQAWNPDQLRSLAPRFAQLGVKLIEQPLARTDDRLLAKCSSDVPLCADESCQTSDCLPAIVDKYQYVNIKLDKAGGLTEALRLVREAREKGLRLMVGCMGGSSLSMAPAFIVGQFCEFVDLDGPLLLRADVTNGIQYQGSLMSVPEAALWG
jgi:L-Ala-D/L-Glu epimerase